MAFTQQPEALNAAELLVRALEQEGVEYIFGLPGEENLLFLEALRDHPTIKLVLTRHEQAAGFMAASYWRFTGKVAVAYSTLGAGATNLTTAAAHAYLGGFAVLFITGQKPLRNNRQGLYQLLDTTGLMRPITKSSRTIENGADVATLVHEAFTTMLSGRSGPAHLELPEDVAADATDGLVFPVAHAPAPVASDETLEEAARLIYEARSPLLMVGAAAQAQGVPAAFRELAATIGVPYVSTWMGKGVADEADANFLGSIIMPDIDYPGAAATGADVILNIGHDLAEKAPFLMRPDDTQTVIHVNTFPAYADHIYFPQHQVVGNIEHSLRRLTKLCNGTHQSRYGLRKAQQSLRLAPGETPAWDFSRAKQLGVKFRASICRGAKMSGSAPIKPQFLAAATRAALPDDGIVTLDNGIHKLWFTRNFPMRYPRSHIVDSALGAMGPALPAAIAASLAYPDRSVLAVAGDGGFMMNAQELETAHRLKLSIVVMILNDNGLGMIRMKQEMEGTKPLAVDFGNPDFVKLAEAHGACGHRPENGKDLLRILDEAIAGGLHVIDVPIDYGENQSLLEEMQRAIPKVE